MTPIKERRRVVETGAATITFLFAVFGGALADLAPPPGLVAETHPQRTIGLASFIALLVLLLAVVLGGRLTTQTHRRIWLGVSIVALVGFVALAVTYSETLAEKTFTFVDGTRVTRGDALTPWATEQKHNFEELHPGEILGPAELLSKVGRHRIEAVWTAESIAARERGLTRHYVAVVIALAVALFSLLEGLLSGRIGEGGTEPPTPGSA